LPLWSLCNILSDERMGLSFTIAAGPSQRSHSQVRVPWASWLLLCLRFETPPTWRARSLTYIPQEQGGPVIPPGTGVLFSSLPTTRMTTVEVFEPGSTREHRLEDNETRLYTDRVWQKCLLMFIQRQTSNRSQNKQDWCNGGHYSLRRLINGWLGNFGGMKFKDVAMGYMLRKTDARGSASH
jgi:hypothetical protein